jgi:hypothetical protein
MCNAHCNHKRRRGGGHARLSSSYLTECYRIARLMCSASVKVTSNSRQAPPVTWILIRLHLAQRLSVCSLTAVLRGDSAML